MRLVVFILTIALLAFGLQACAQKGRASGAHQKQGLEGTVLFLTGNHMPGPAPGNGGKSQRVARKILLYAPALNAGTLPEGAVEGSFVTLPLRTPAFQTTSKEDGSFRLGATPGTYTLLIQEPDGRLFCNGTDGAGLLCPVTVEKGKWEKRVVSVNYGAAY